MRWRAAERLQQFLRQESNRARAAYGLAIAGHLIIALLLIVGAFTRIEAASVDAIPVGIVMEKPDAPPAPPPANEQNKTPQIPTIADADKHAKAPLATLDVNGLDLPKQPGHDGGDPIDAEFASLTESLPSWAIDPIGLAQRQATAREPGKDELTALKEPKIECGVKAKVAFPGRAIRKQVRVLGFVTEGQTPALIRSTQVVIDRRINPNYITSRHVFTETMDGATKSTVALPAGLAVNEGDVIEVDLGHIDPSNPCQYIPNLAVSKL